jgi:hypothetical protein
VDLVGQGSHRHLRDILDWPRETLFAVRQLREPVLAGRVGYPAIGIYFADCPSAGHDMVCLDYRECGPSGEPRVVHVDQEWGYQITFVAESFEAFIRGLESGEAFEQEA